MESVSNDKITNIVLGLILGLAFAIFMILIYRMDKNQVILLMPQTGSTTETYVIKQPEPVQETMQQTEKTRVVMSRPTTITGTARLIQLSGKGRIDELSIITENPNARVRIMVDGKLIINESIEDLKDLSTYSNWLGVQELGNETVVIITDVEYNKNFEAVLSTSQPTTVKLIGKYKEVI